MNFHVITLGSTAVTGKIVFAWSLSYFLSNKNLCKGDCFLKNFPWHLYKGCWKNIIHAPF
jgi:hypothetical protein